MYDLSTCDALFIELREHSLDAQACEELFTLDSNNSNVQFGTLLRSTTLVGGPYIEIIGEEHAMVAAPCVLHCTIHSKTCDDL